MTCADDNASADGRSVRKERGAFFTPNGITQFLSEWAIRTPDDLVMEPAAGDAAFLVAVVARLRQLEQSAEVRPSVDGFEIHARSAEIARQRVFEAGGQANIRQCDFFAIEPEPSYDVVLGNPPYIRYQTFTGEARARAREAALRGGISLTGLASSWAAFSIHSILFLKKGGRLALVLPAELLSVNYAAPVRKFLLERFRHVQLVLFDEQVFPEAEADVVLLLAEGHLEGPAHHATIRRSKNVTTLASLDQGQNWTPPDPAGKWTSLLADPGITALIVMLLDRGFYTHLESWGDTTVGMVTGNNNYFTLSSKRVEELGLKSNELLSVSPPGSSHLRGLSLAKPQLARLGDEGHGIHLFYPSDPPSAEAAVYIRDGHRTGVDMAYKCRIRKTWYRVPLTPAPDLLLTCMNADTPRITANEAGARHLNSVHGIYLKNIDSVLGRELLPVASLNSVTLLHAEMVGRAYGGGVLKIEPKEADVWAVPSPSLILSQAETLREAKQPVAKLLDQGRLLEAVRIVDQVFLTSSGAFSLDEIERVRETRTVLANRRNVRGASGRQTVVKNSGLGFL